MHGFGNLSLSYRRQWDILTYFSDTHTVYNTCSLSWPLCDICTYWHVNIGIHRDVHYCIIIFYWDVIVSWKFSPEKEVFVFLLLCQNNLVFILMGYLTLIHCWNVVCAAINFLYFLLLNTSPQLCISLAGLVSWCKKATQVKFLGNLLWNWLCCEKAKN